MEAASTAESAGEYEDEADVATADARDDGRSGAEEAAEAADADGTEDGGGGGGGGGGTAVDVVVAALAALPSDTDGLGLRAARRPFMAVAGLLAGAPQLSTALHRYQANVMRRCGRSGGAGCQVEEWESVVHEIVVNHL